MPKNDKLVALLLRHGETPPNKRHLLKGLMDPPLDPTGEQQIREAARFLSRFPIERFMSSPLLRAHQAAIIVAGFIDVWPIQTRGLFPWDVGSEFIDKPKENSGLEKYVKDPSLTPPNGVSLNKTFARIHEFLSHELPKGVLTLYCTHNSFITIAQELMKESKERHKLHPVMHSVVKPGGVVGIFSSGKQYEMQPLFGETDGEKYASS
jgi:broad specificity phosphatase PhoE